MLEKENMSTPDAPLSSSLHSNVQTKESLKGTLPTPANSKINKVEKKEQVLAPGTSYKYL